MTGQARWKVIVYAAALFIAGAVSGAMVAYHKAETSPFRVDRTKEIADHIRQRLETKLDLTPEQAKKIEPAIEKAAEELEASHRDCLNRISAALDKMHLEIAPVLGPDQQAMLKQLEVERRDLMRQKYNYSPSLPTSGGH
jgi:Spy/CpxP family protein refolding chaperone